jgi:hypothetical protein
VSVRTIGVIGLTSGVVALVAQRLAIGSWLVPGAAFVVWSLSGWRLFFNDARKSRPVRALGYVILSSGVVVAGAIVLKLYLAALGSAWKL